MAHDNTDNARAAEFDLLFRTYRSKVFRFALASLRDRDVAETITQDCFLRAYKGLDRFRNDCSCHTWLMQIAVNLVRDHTRNRRFQFWKRVERAGLPAESLGDRMQDGQSSPESRMLLKEQVGAIWVAAAGLPERQRTVFLLRFVEDMDILEIAAVAGMKEGTVKAHLFRALHAVRERLGAAR